MPVFRLLPSSCQFPNPEWADPDGLLAVGGDLSPTRLFRAYTSGIFPWYAEEHPILWWSPDPRCVLLPGDLHVPRSLKRVLNAGRFTITFDTAFERVITACATPRNDGNGTWLVPEMIQAYVKMHDLGLAHSAEAWRDGELAGGLYGISLGTIFFGESMFHSQPDASKIALVRMVEALFRNGCTMIDCQQETHNLLRFGARAIPRARFMELLGDGLNRPTRLGSWQGGLETARLVETAHIQDEKNWKRQSFSTEE